MHRTIAMKLMIIALFGCAFAAPALAQEPAGCDKFKWPIEQEQRLLSGAAITKLASGSAVAAAFPVAVEVTLMPLAEAKLPRAPERAPRLSSSFAGFIAVAAPFGHGVVKISLSSEAWIDVLQNGVLVKSQGFTGATACTGIRKSVRFDLKTERFVVQLSNVAGNAIRIAITAD